MSRTLITAIDHWAQERPEAEAFRFGNRALSYRTLSDQSARLAGWLAAQAVGRGDLVAIHLRKSIEMPIAVFGIMKAGAAYVPLDPAAPAARLRGIAEACEIPVVISHPPMAARTAELVAGPSPVRAVFGGADWDALVDLEPGGTQPTPEDLAYIIFTSGSTGAPKGIQHTHQSAAAYADMSARLYDVQPGDRLANHSPLHFDMSTFEFFAGPLAGATSVIIPEPHLKMPASLSELVENERITIWYSTPFALVQMAEHGVLPKRDLSALRWIIFGGEPFTRKGLLAFGRHAPNARFSNSYGPAEVNQCTYLHLAHDDLATDAPIPLGGPCPGATIDLLDPETDAPGETGELCVQTASMMRGYKGRADLDAATLFRDAGGRRWYRTGDLARRDAGGQLVYVGRKDRQTKIRGFRVELEEVEAALMACPGISEAAAVVTAEGAAELIGFVAADGQARPTSDGLRAALAQKLPHYAVPARIDIVESFPRTTSGKIDRNALAAAFKESTGD